MSRRIDIELTSARDDGSWTWRAAGAREPRGTLEASLLPTPGHVGDVLKVEIDGYLDGLSVVAVVPPRAARNEPERLELRTGRAEEPLVTTALVPGRPAERGGRRRGDRSDRGDRGERRSDDRGRRGERRGEPRPEGRGDREDRAGGSGGSGGAGGRPEGRGDDRGRRERRPSRDRDRDRQEVRHDRPSRPAPPPLESKPKPKRLRPGRVHRTALLEAVPAEQRPIAEQLLLGGIPSVRQAIERQNDELRAAGKPEVPTDSLLRVAEDLRPQAMAAAWRDRAEAAVAVVEELDLRDLRSVVNAAGDAGRDEESRALAAQLREALTNRVEKEHAAWLADLAETVQAGRIVRALRLSSRPPKAGAPIPGDIATQLAEGTAAALNEEAGPDRWATVLEALAYSPVRRRVIPQSLPAKLTPELKATIARLASRLPEIAHIFNVESAPAADRPPRGQSRRRPDRKGGDGRKPSGGGRGEGGRETGGGKGPRKGRGGAPRPTAADAKAEAAAPVAEAPPVPADEAAAPAAEAPPADEAPPAEEAPAATDEAAVPAVDAPPAEETPAPTAEAPAPTDEAAAPTAEASPAEEAPAPTDEAAAPTAEAPAPTDEAAAPTAEASPAEEAPAPTDEAAAPTAEAPAPTDEAAAPTAEAPAATDEAAAPVAEAPPAAEAPVPTADAAVERT